MLFLRRLLSFLRNSTKDQWVFIEAVVLMPLFAVALHRIGFKQTRAWLEERSPSDLQPSSPENFERARRIGKLVNYASRYSPYRANCLKRSLCVWWLLRRRHIDSELRIGVRKGQDGLEAHAWIEIGGVVVNDAPSFVRTFTPFAGDVMAAYRFIN